MKKIIIVASFIICLILSLVIFLKNRNYVDKNTNLSIFLNNIETKKIPEKSSGYVLDEEKSNCTNGSTLTWDKITWSPVLKNMTKTRTKCNLYFKSENFNIILFSENASFTNGYQLTNMIQNGGFENGLENWTIQNANITTTNDIVYEGNTAVVFKKNSDFNGASRSAIITQIPSQKAPILNHLYYGSYMFYSSNNFSTGDSRFEWWNSDDFGGRINFISQKIPTNNNWKKMSSINKKEEDIYVQDEWRLRNFARNSNEDSYGDNIILLDLTEIFGVNNEPTKEFIDQYIPFFETTASILNVSQNSLESKTYSFTTTKEISNVNCSVSENITITNNSITITNPYDNVYCILK